MRKKAKIVGIGIVAILILTNVVVAETQSREQVNTPTVCSMQPPEVEWEKTYGGPELDILYCIQETDDGGYVACGLTEESDVYYVWLLKLDSDGNEEWNIINYDTYGSTPPADVMALYMLQTNDGGYVISGYGNRYFEEVDGILSRGFLWKVDAIGTTEWIEEYIDLEPMTTACAWAMVEVDDGYMASGTTYYGRNKGFLMKTDSTGVMEWQKIYEGGEIYSLCCTDDGGYLLTGSSPTGFWMIKTDANGNEEWNKTFGESRKEWTFVRNCFQASDGGYVMCGLTSSFGAGSTDLWIVKTDASGDMEWNETFGEETREEIWSMDATNDGGYIFSVCRNHEGFTASKDDIWIIKTDSDGNAQWSLIYGGSEPEVGSYISKTSDGGYIVSGRKNAGWLSPENDALIVKIGPDKEMVTPEMQVQKPKSGRLYLFDIIGFPFPFTPNALVLGDLTFSVEASDASGIGKVEFFIDDKVVGEATEAPYTYEWTGAEKGTYTLKIRAYNNYGGTTQETVTIQKIM